MFHPIKTTVLYNTALPTIKVLLIPCLHDNYSYVAIADNTHAIVIDPSNHIPIVAEIENRNLSLQSILITHDHADHTCGAVSLQKKYNVPIIAPLGSQIEGNITEVGDGYSLAFRDTSFKVIWVPGHPSTKHNNISWYNSNAQIVFTGDALFPCGYGYITKGYEKMMWESLGKLRSFPDETLLFCGHEYTAQNTTFANEIDPCNKTLAQRLENVKTLLANGKPTIPTTIQFEKENNPFLRWDDKNLKKQLGIIEKEDFESFLYIRELKNEFNKRG